MRIIENRVKQFFKENTNIINKVRIPSAREYLCEELFNLGLNIKNINGQYEKNGICVLWGLENISLNFYRIFDIENKEKTIKDILNEDDVLDYVKKLKIK